MVSDAALAAAADNAPRSARSRLKQAVASAAAVRHLELRLAGGKPDAQSDTSTGAVADAQNDTPASSPADAVLHTETDTPEGADLHVETDAGWATETDRAEVSL